jgi:hypothetical protein
MKNLLFLLIFTPLFVLAQNEKEQKSNIRNNTQSSTQNSPNRVTNTEIYQKQEIRRETQPPKQTIIIREQPYYGRPWGFNSWDRWNRWGAPYSYVNYYDWDIYDRWGYRKPARIYQLPDGKNDTIVSKKNKTRIGFNFTSDNQVGGWITVGKGVYFKGQFSKYINQDKSEYYSHPDVNFYNATNVWKDQRLEDITKGWSMYLGVGREFKNIGVNISLGFGQETENFQFFDEYYQLSSNGKYSFKNFVDDYMTLSFGVTHDYKFLSINGDFDPIRKTFSLGAGFNF